MIGALMPRWHPVLGRPRALWTKGGSGLLQVETLSDRSHEEAGTDPYREPGKRRRTPTFVTALVYYGGRRLRRVDFRSGRPRKVWERRIGHMPRTGTCGRIAGNVIFEGRQGGLAAVSAGSGEYQWHLDHPAEIHTGPVALPDGDLLVIFRDQRWVRLQPTTGKRTDEGRVKSERQAQKMAAEGAPLVGVARTISRTSSGHRVALNAVLREGYRATYEPEDWTLGPIVEMVGSTLAIPLERVWEETRSLGVALLDADSLEPQGVVELGRASSWDRFEASYVVDGCIAFVQGRQTFVVEPKRGSVLLELRQGGKSTLFGADHQPLWRGRL